MSFIGVLLSLSHNGSSTPASMQVMVVDNCVRFTSLAVNETAVNIAKDFSGYIVVIDSIVF